MKCAIQFHRVMTTFALATIFFSYYNAIQADTPSTTPNKIVSNGEDRLGFSITNSHDVTLVAAGFSVWGPQWKWISTGDGANVDGGVGATLTFNAATQQTMTAGVESLHPAPLVTSYKYTLTSAKEIPLTAIALQFLVPDGVTDVTVTLAGTQDPITESVPILRADTVTGVSKVILHLGGQDTVMVINPPASVAFIPRGIRLLLASDLFKAGTATTTLTLSPPASAGK